jgi:hypothetical protein
MSDCEFHSGCAFYAGTLKAMPADAEAIKQNYCLSNPLHCSRFMAADVLGMDKVPDDLMPPQKDRAYQLIAQG